MKQGPIFIPPSLPERLLRLIYPVKCMVCETILIENCTLYICPSCKKNLPRYGWGFVKNREVNFVDGLFAAFCYYDGIETAIHTMKYSNHPKLAQTMGRILWEELLKQESIPQFDYIIPIPMHPKKKRQRGYNQSELIAKELSLLLDKKVRIDMLIKTRHTRAQSLLKREERLDNLQGAFTIGKGNIAELAGKSILLVDDVITTGTTMSSCANILRENGVSSIYSLVIAIA